MLILFFQIPKILVLFFYTRLHENELWHLEWYNPKVDRIPPVDIPSLQHFVSMGFRRTFWCGVVMLLPIPLESVSDTISNWFENYKPHRAQISTSLKLEKMSSNSWPQPQVFWAYFLTPAIFKDSKATSRFPVSCIRFEDFAVQPFTVCSFHDERRSIYVWQWRDFPWPSAILCALWRNCNLQLQLWQLFYWLINLVINKW